MPIVSSVVRGPAALDRHPHQLADAFPVERRKRVVREHAVLEVAREELALGVVAREPERSLRQVVGAEGEEVGVTGDLVGSDTGARKLDHRPDRYGRSQPSSDATLTVSSRRRRSSSAKATSGCMISTRGARPVRSRTATAARTIARTCVS